MLNFKSFNYDIIDINDSLNDVKSLTRDKFNNALKENEFLIIKEYINPKFNTMLPKDMQLNEHYYIYNQNETNVVKISKEYFEFFKNAHWNAPEIYNKLKEERFGKYATKHNPNFFKEVPGIRFKNFWYLVLASMFIFTLLFNIVSSPWNGEFLGDNSQTYNSISLEKYPDKISPIEFNDTVQNEYTQAQPADWSRFQKSYDLKFSLCSTSNNNSYILVSNSKSGLKEKCEGRGVVTSLNNPVFNAPISDFLPENVIARDKLTATNQISYSEGIALLTKDLELKGPLYTIYADAKIVTPKEITTRIWSTLLIAFIPSIIGIIGLYRARLFKNKLIDKKS
jgi:hypothetical protein